MTRDPETRDPILMCIREHRPTRHRYEGSTRAATPEQDPTPHYRLMFACVTCGEARQWGSSDQRPAEEYRPPLAVTVPGATA